MLRTIFSFIVIVVLSVCLGCGSRKSHVVKSKHSDLQVNRELTENNTRDLQLELHGSVLSIDSTWRSWLLLKNWKGEIHSDGSISGSADEVLAQSEGKLAIAEENNDEVLALVDQSELRMLENISKTEDEDMTKNTTRKPGAPWWVWLTMLVCAVGLVTGIYIRFKSKLRII